MHGRITWTEFDTPSRSWKFVVFGVSYRIADGEVHSAWDSFFPGDTAPLGED